jgi:hypothetical protein
MSRESIEALVTFIGFIIALYATMYTFIRWLE